MAKNKMNTAKQRDSCVWETQPSWGRGKPPWAVRYGPGPQFGKLVRNSAYFRITKHFWRENEAYLTQLTGKVWLRRPAAEGDKTESGSGWTPQSLHFKHCCYLRQGGYVFIFVSLCVCLLAGSRKNYSTDFHKIWWKGGMWKKPLDFDGNPDHVTLR